MVTNTTKRISRNKIMKTQAYIVLVMLVVIGGVIGFFIGKFTVPVKVETITLTETVEAPPQSDELKNEEFVFYDYVPLSYELQNYLFAICKVENVPMSLVLAMIDHESNFNQDVISSTSDYGLMQINKTNHKWLSEAYGITDFLEPHQNLYSGVKIISEHLKEYNSDYTKALMAYNMGATGAKRAWDNGEYSSDYSIHVLGLWQKYEEVNGNGTSVINE